MRMQLRPEWLVILAFVSYWQLGQLSVLGAQTDFGTDYAREIMRLAKSAEMRNYLQSSADPCDNFYTYACGSWHRINNAHKQSKNNILITLGKEYDRKLVQLLRLPQRSGNDGVEAKVKNFYESCVNRAQVRRHYRENLLSVMEEFGGMPALKGDQWQADKFDWVQVSALILRKYGDQIIIGASISPDLNNNEANRLYVGQLDTLVSSQDVDYYKELRIVRIVEFQRELGMSFELASKTATEMVNFERRLALGVADPLEGLGMEDLTRLRMLDEMSESYSPYMNFTKFVSVWLGYEYRLPVYEYVQSYNSNLFKIMAATPKHVVANYIMWMLAENFRIYVEDTDEKQQASCVAYAKNHFIKYLDNLVYRHLLQHNDNITADVLKIWKDLKNAFEEMLKAKEADWLSERTRDKALEKLSAMTLVVSTYEDEDFAVEYAGLAIGRDNYFENIINLLEHRGDKYRQKLLEPPKLEEAAIMSASPSYVSEYNQVNVPVAFLQPRFLWDDAYPTALKYATIGFIIAHEMAHGFDDKGRKYDAKGNLNSWWDRNSTKGFALRKECLRHQYGEYEYGGRKLPKVNAQGENIADNVGIRVAYNAYYNSLTPLEVNSTRWQTESLPRMHFTPHQLFFVGAAQMWCTDVNQRWRKMFASSDLHATEEVRVRAMLSNFDEFAINFQCRTAAKMNPPHKCVFY